MVRNGEIALADIKRVLRKHWWVIPVSLVASVALAMFLVIVLPKQYTSKTVILVEEPGVPSDYVKPISSETINQRLATMQEQIISRAQLKAVIEKFALYSGDRGQTPIEDLVNRLRKTIIVTPLNAMPGTSSPQLPGFGVSVKFSNPQTARDICSEVTSMFLEESARRNAMRAQETTNFLNQELSESKQTLDEQDAALAKFKQEHFGKLPDQEQTNLSLLAGMDAQLEAVTQSLNAEQRDKAFNQTMLDAQLASWQQTLKGGQDVDVQEQQLIDMQNRLSDMLLRYTAEHPDVKKMKAQIEDLKKRMAEDPEPRNPAVLATKHEPLQIQHLRLRIKQDEQQMAETMRKQDKIQEEIHQLQGRVQATPGVEEDFKKLTRNYETALEGYKDLLRKHASASEATDLQHQQEGEQFRVLDPPTLPFEPSFPNKLYFTGGGFGFGLALSAGLLYVFALSDKSMHTERDVEICLKLPVLTTVPDLEVMTIEKLSRRQKPHESAIVFEA